LLLLAIDTTTRVCSVALGDHEKIWAEYQLNGKNTHSQRLMPLIVSLFRDSGIDKSRLEGVALTIGPGSFTGIRIGMATAKGLCQGLNIPAVGVMTLDALAEACTFFPGLICPILDARKNQVYTALYRGAAGDPEMLQPAAALSIDELGHKLAAYEDEVIFLGDAVESYGGALRQILGQRYREMPLPSRLNRAALVLQKGIKLWQEKGPVSPYALKPLYIRLPEAERRLQERKQEGRV
jgi:tRNA threonylcarbamoyladenosine biosynthesis protein TsaB